MQYFWTFRYTYLKGQKYVKYIMNPKESEGKVNKINFSMHLPSAVVK